MVCSFFFCCYYVHIVDFFLKFLKLWNLLSLHFEVFKIFNHSILYLIIVICLYMYTYSYFILASGVSNKQKIKRAGNIKALDSKPGSLQNF